MNSNVIKTKKRNSAAMRTLGVTMFKKGIWVTVIWSVLMLILTVLMIDGTGYTFHTGRGFDYLTDELNECLPQFAISIIFAAFTGAMQFSFMSRVNSVGFIHSLPMSRNEIFMSVYLSGVVSVLIPQAVLALTTLFIPWKFRFLFALLVFAVGAVYSVGVYSFGVMMSMFSASTTGSVFFTLFGLATPYLVEAFIRIIMSTSFYGFYEEISYFIIDFVYLIPAAVMSLKGLIYVFAIVIFTFFAYILYKRRPSELAGDLVAFPAIRSVITVICGIIAGICGYLIFGRSLLVFCLFGIICCVLVNFAVKKKFKLKSSLVYSGILAAITIVLCCIFVFDITGFEKRIPASDDIESVRIYNNRYGEGRIVLYGEDRKPDFYVEEQETTEEYEITAIREMHQCIIDDCNNYYGDDDIHYLNRGMIIEYRLKNGSTLKRMYRPDYFGEETINAIARVNSLPSIIKIEHPQLRDDVRITGATFCIYDYPESYEKKFTGDNIHLLAEAIEKDLKAMPAEGFRMMNDYGNSPSAIEFKYYYTEAFDANGERVDDERVLRIYEYHKSEIITQYHTNTIELLKQLGCGEYIKYADVDEMKY